MQRGREAEAGRTVVQDRLGDGHSKMKARASETDRKTAGERKTAIEKKVK